jgi:uncharacterized protein HemX
MADWAAAKFFLDLVALVLAVGSCIYTWHKNRNQAHRDQIEKLKAEVEDERNRRRHDVTDLATRLTGAETRLNDAPTGKAMHEVAVSIERLSGDLRAAVARMDGVHEIVKRLDAITNRQEEFLLNMPRGA